MYTRPYDERSGIVIPESYGGTALFDKEPPSASSENDTVAASGAAQEGQRNPWESERVHTEKGEEREKSEPVGSFLSKLPFGNLFGGILGNGRFGLQKIGTEEILIIATAAFLLFSKDGDKECAIMLILLLFLS